MSILDHVEITDLINVKVYLPNIMQPGKFQVDLQPIEFGKCVVVDEDALKKLNEVLVDKCQQFKSARDPRVPKYIEEFVARMAAEWYRNGLLVIEDVPDAKEDPYSKIRREGEEYARGKRNT